MAEMISNSSLHDIEKEKFSLNELIQTCLRKWSWFVISLFICLGLGFLYIKCQEPEYQRSEEILIKDQESGGGVSGMSSTFASMGLISGKTNVFNELISITSPAILAEVIKRLDLEVDYVESGFFHGVTLYGTTLPFKTNFIDVDSQSDVEFKCILASNGSISLYDFLSFTSEGKKIKYSEEYDDVKVGDTIKTPIGKVQFVNNPSFEPLVDDDGKSKKITVRKSGFQSAIEFYSKKIQGDLKDEYADVIELVMKDVNVERAVDVLTEILVVYNENWVEDKNKIAKATSAFIEDRLRVIEKELGEVDNNIAQYRSTNGAINLHQKGSSLMEKEETLENQIVNINNNLALCRYMLDYLKNSSNKFNIIPNNVGAQSREVEAQIETYNELLLSRNALESSSSAANPIVKDYDAQLDDLRGAILKGMSNRMVQLENLLSSAKKEQLKAQSSLQSTPIQSLPLLSEQRQQSVKENLYLFLLEKREENELSQKFTADNTRILTPPMGSLRPISPKKGLIMLSMFMLGFIIPLTIIYLKQTSDTKVRGKKDLDNVKIPFAGEIPFVGKPKTLDIFGKLKSSKKDDKAPLSVVQEGKRDVVNEAFRVIRSNIDFMIGRNKECAEIIMITSFNPGSGKSFISYNLGLSFSLKKKRVLVIDCDLRHGSSSMYVGLPNKGVTNYLTGSTDDWHSLVKKSNSMPMIDILPVGKMPPNPVELLENGRLEKLVLEAKSEYDNIILDCPPVNIVVDTQIVAQCADRTLFVVRAGMLEKSALSELDEFYESKKFKNMSVLLNGTSAVHSRYYTYGTYQNYVD